MNEKDYKLIEDLKERTINHKRFSQEESEIAFELLNFYYYPNRYFDSIISSREYHRIPYYRDFFMNNDFIELLLLALDDDEFLKKVSLDQLLNLRQYVGDNYNYYQYRSCISLNLDNKKLQDFNFDAASTTYDKLGMTHQRIDDRTVQLENKKKYYLDYIRVDRYSEDYKGEYLLETNSVNIEMRESGYREDYVQSVVLENRFIDVINELLDYNGMNESMMDGALEVLNLGVRIKEHHLKQKEGYLHNLFSKEQINLFDCNRAKETISRITIMKLKQKSKKLRNNCHLKIIK